MIKIFLISFRDSKLTQLLREAMGSVMCRVAMIAHVSTTPARYPEALATLQLASRIHRLRRKKLKVELVESYTFSLII